MSNECIFELGEGVEKRTLKVGIPTGNCGAGLKARPQGAQNEWLQKGGRPLLYTG